ncbi:MAG: glycosyltransferase family 2 protein [Methylacidiphilales bacterium]|nr:glycosyltransferase family 2 protein [Candidatus Methylacidiphilales bacterium]
MRISVIIPSYQTAAYLEQTLLSVLEQGHADLELLVIDGGSTDGSIDILRKYERHLAFWCSEPDRGQAHAINKGLHRMSGEVWSYLNSDDLLSPGALRTVVDLMSDPSLCWLGGVAEIFCGEEIIGRIDAHLPDHKSDFLTPWNRPYPYVFPCSVASFMRRGLFEEIGDLNEHLHYSMDIEYYARCVFQKNITPRLIPEILGRWRWHDTSKTSGAGMAYGFREDEIQIAETYLSLLTIEEQARLKQELRFEKKQIIARKAVYLHQQGVSGKALDLLLRSAFSNPSQLWFRPWLGAMRRCFIPRKQALGTPV